MLCEENRKSNVDCVSRDFGDMREIPFGLLASLIIYILHPAVIKLVDKLSPTALFWVAIILFVIYIIDNVISTYILFKIKGKIKSERKDNTEKIKQYIHHSLTNAKWSILSLQEKHLSFTHNELSKEYNSIINYLKKK